MDKEKPHEVYDVLDHLMIINWIEYMSHKAGAIGKENINFDGRPYIILPSGKKIKIIIKVEEIK